MYQCRDAEWADAETASRTLVGFAGMGEGFRCDVGDPAVSGALASLVIHGIRGEDVSSSILRERRLGYFRLDGLERDHVKQVLARCHIDSAELLEAIVENPALTDSDVTDLATKLWDGSPARAGSLWVTGRRVLGESQRVAGRALGALSQTWWDTCWTLPGLALKLSRGGEAAVEVYATLADDAARERRLNGINGETNAELVDQALLLVAAAGQPCRETQGTDGPW